MITETQVAELKQALIQIAARDEEIAAYQRAIDGYQATLARLPVEWPPELIAYRDTQGYDDVPVELVDQVHNLRYRAEVETNLKANKIQQSKAKHYRQSFIDQISPEVNWQPQLENEKLLLDALQRTTL